MDAKEKGVLGEAKVFDEINSVISRLDFDCRVIKNARFPFESVYGKRGFITTEIDTVVFTPYFIFLFEVKNQNYAMLDLADYEEPIWKLMNKETVSNPIEQNHTHKEVFCSELNIPREQVITVEVLLNNECHPNIKSRYPNDYIFSLDDIKNRLVYLLATTSNKMMEVDYAYQQFKELLKKRSISEEEHIKHLKRTAKIETRIRNVIGYVNLHRTDVVHCPSCGIGKLYFKDKSYLSTRKSQRKSQHYFLGCSSYGNDDINCNVGLIYVDGHHDSSLFKKIKTDSIAKRNNWGDEKVIKTILDEIEMLESTNQDLYDEVEKLKYENSMLKEILDESKREKDSQMKQIVHLTKQSDILKDNLDHFKQVFGKIYILKE